MCSYMFSTQPPMKKNGEFVSTCETDQVAAMLSTNQQPWRGHKGDKVMKLYPKKGTPHVFGDVIWMWDSPVRSDQEKPMKPEHGSSTPQVDVDGLITWWNIQVKSIVEVVFHPSWKKSTIGTIHSPNRKQNMKKQVLKLNTYITISNKGPTCLKNHSFRPSDLVWELCP